MRLCTLLLLFWLGAVAPVAADLSVTRVEYVEEWRTRSDDAAPYLMGVVSAVTLDGEGRFYLLDDQLQQVHRFGPDGAHEGIIVGKGPGPGEIERSHRFARWTGDEIAIVRGFPAALTVVSTDGTPLRDIHFDDGSDRDVIRFLSTAARAGDVILAEGSRSVRGSGGKASEQVLAVFDIEGKLRFEIASQPDLIVDLSRPHLLLRETDLVFSAHRHALGFDGTVFIAPDRERYHIVRWSARGEIIAEITRPDPARRRSPEEIERERSQHVIHTSPGLKLPEIEYAMEPTQPPIEGLTVVGDELWVRLDAPDLSDDAIGRWALYDFGGEGREIIEIALPYDPDLDTWSLLRDGRVAVVENARDANRAARAQDAVRIGEDPQTAEIGEAGPMQVVIYAPRAD